MQDINTLNTYVATKYGTDNLFVSLNETTFEVTVNKADVYGNAISGGLVVDQTYQDLPTAIKEYLKIIEQIHEGDDS